MSSKIIATLVFLAVAGAQQQQPASPTASTTSKHTFHYGVEWRLIRAGLARLVWTPDAGGEGFGADLHVESAGLVSKLHRVNDDYKAVLDKAFCPSSVLFKSEEGKRRRETRITFDGKSKVSYLERDLVKNNVVLQKDIEAPPCVHEYVSGLAKLRNSRLEVGQSTNVALTDGKKFANVKVEAQEREQVKTPAGTFSAIRYEIHMFNGVLLNRKARMHVWISDDARRLPVQLRVRLSVLVGNITLQLEKIE